MVIRRTCQRDGIPAPAPGHAKCYAIHIGACTICVRAPPAKVNTGFCYSSRPIRIDHHVGGICCLPQYHRAAHRCLAVKLNFQPAANRPAFVCCILIIPMLPLVIEMVDRQGRTRLSIHIIPYDVKFPYYQHVMIIVRDVMIQHFKTIRCDICSGHIPGAPFK